MKRTIADRSRCLRWASLIALALLASSNNGSKFGLVVAQESTTHIVEVEAGERDRDTGLIEYRLPDDAADLDVAAVRRVSDGTLFPVQRDENQAGTIVWRLKRPLMSGERRQFELITGDSTNNIEPQPDESLQVEAVRDHGKIILRSSEKTILAYHEATVSPPEGSDPLYARSGFIHPLKTPGGAVLTDDFPPDHLHQHGIFRAWVKTQFSDKAVDFWNQKKGQGTVRHRDTAWLTSGPVFAAFQVQLEHIAKDGDRDVVVLNETWTVRAWPSAESFVIDIESRQRAASSKPLLIQEYHYGGFGIRGHREWTAENFDFVTSNGDDRLVGNHTRPNWVMMPGRVEDREVYAVAMGHPSNFRHPQPVRLHPTMPYFCFAPMVLGNFSIDDQRELVGRIRLFTGDGRPASEVIDGWFEDYQTPLKAKLVRAEP